MKKQKLNQQWECIYFLRPEIIGSAKFICKEKAPPSPEGESGQYESPLGPLGDAIAKSGGVLGTAFSIMDTALEAGEKSKLAAFNEYIKRAIALAKANKIPESIRAFQEAFQETSALKGKDKLIAYQKLAEVTFGWYKGPDKVTTLRYLFAEASIIIDNMPLQDRVDACEPLLHIAMHLYNAGDHTYSVEDVFRKKYLAAADLMPSSDEKINAYRTIQVLAGSWGYQDVEGLAKSRIEKTMADKKAAGKTVLAGLGDVFHDYIGEAVKLIRANKRQEAIQAFRDALSEIDTGQNQTAKAMEYIVLAKNIADHLGTEVQLPSPQNLLGMAKDIAVQIPESGNRLKVYRELAPALKKAGLDTSDIFRDCFAIADSTPTDSIEGFNQKISRYKFIENLARDCGQTNIVRRAAEEREKLESARLQEILGKS